MIRLFHVSETPDTKVFEPRSPTREDLDPNSRMVWAIAEDKIRNYLLPRDCPRVTFYATRESSPRDVERLMGYGGAKAVVAVESKWLPRILETVLYVYEFDPAGFVLEDEIAGYYIATTPQKPVAVTRVDNIPGELLKQPVELRIMPNLWGLRDEVVQSTLGFSIIRMANATPREAPNLTRNI